MQVEIPGGHGGRNPFLTGWLLGNECRRLVSDAAGTAHNLYLGMVTWRTGRLAMSAMTSTRVGGKAGDRIVGVLAVGAEYALADEYGRRHKAPYEGERALNEVLAMMGGR